MPNKLTRGFFKFSQGQTALDKFQNGHGKNSSAKVKFLNKI